MNAVKASDEQRIFRNTGMATIDSFIFLNTVVVEYGCDAISRS